MWWFKFIHVNLFDELQQAVGEDEDQPGLEQSRVEGQPFKTEEEYQVGEKKEEQRDDQLVPVTAGDIESKSLVWWILDDNLKQPVRFNTRPYADILVSNIFLSANLVEL